MLSHKKGLFRTDWACFIILTFLATIESVKSAPLPPTTTPTWKSQKTAKMLEQG
jgi:hypothetical protein